MGHDAANSEQHALEAIAARFVEARLTARALADFPGDIPSALEDAYRCQDAAIACWPSRVVGWKVGWIAPALRVGSSDERLVGPIFERNVREIDVDEVVDVPVFVGGFAAVEGEFVVRVAADAPADKIDWSADEAHAYVEALHVGIEMAGSPLATINQLGPRVVVSDFGNNAGLLVGPRIADWRERDARSMTVRTTIADRLVGEGSAASIDGGPVAAFAFALARNARRGRPLRRGDWITTGAVTGIHDIVAGQSARVAFAGIGELRCRAVAAVAHAGGSAR